MDLPLEIAPLVNPYTVAVSCNAWRPKGRLELAEFGNPRKISWSSAHGVPGTENCSSVLQPTMKLGTKIILLLVLTVTATMTVHGYLSIQQDQENIMRGMR